MMETTARSETEGFTLFETALGRCGVAWRGTRITSVVLPGAATARTRARLRHPGEAAKATPPPRIAQACSLIEALLAGEAADLCGIAVADDEVPEFDRRVYAVARTIRTGETLTYGEIARRLGNVALAREVGAALGRNPTPLVVPCHRVVAADGSIGGFSAPGGRETKRRLLALEREHAAGTLFTA